MNDFARAFRQPWRVGRTLGRTLYAGPANTDLLGMVETPGLAAYIVKLHNEELERNPPKPLPTAAEIGGSDPTSPGA